MKLSMEIICANLPAEFSARIKGLKNDGLTLERPEFYIGEPRPFLSGHLYIVSAAELSSHTRTEQGAGIICIGNSLYIEQYKERCSLLLVDASVNPMLLFNSLTKIFNTYESWSEKLYEILNSSASLKEMIACSRPVFENPLFVLNADFHYLVHSDYTDQELEQQAEFRFENKKNLLPLDAFEKFLELHKLSLEERKPILLTVNGSSFLNINLFQDNVYCGCLTIEYYGKKCRTGDEALALYLSRFLTLALKKYTFFPGNEKNVLRQSLRDAINGYQVCLSQRRSLLPLHADGEYVCLTIRFTGPQVQLPVEYLCSLIEAEYPNCVALDHESSIVVCAQLGKKEAENTWYETLKSRFTPVIQSLNFHVGVSSAFKRLEDLRLYYLQTCAALENGRLFAPEEHYYLFEDYALKELIINMIGNLPFKMYYSKGLHLLEEHDAQSSVSYLETLRVYLKHNMSATKTAEALYLNRSTLLERLSRIKSLLDSDLSDPDERLRLQILLKALEIHNEIQDQAHPDT